MGHRARHILALVLLLAISGGLPGALGQTRGTVTLISVQGDATVRRSGAGAFVAAARKTTVGVGDIVRTGPTGRMTLLFGDGSQVKLNANTVLLIPATGPRGGMTTLRAVPPRMELSAGEIWARVTKGRRVNIETPSAVAAVRGTDLNLVVAADGTVTLTTAEGEVRFYNPHGSVLVREAQQSVARPGQAPTPPVTVNVPFIIEWTNDVQPVALLLEVRFASDQRPTTNDQRPTAQGREERLRQGDVHHDRGELQEALTLYRAVLAATPEGAARAPVEMRIGHTLLELGRVPEAEAAFRRSLAAAGDGAATADATLARAGLVMALLSRRENEAALAEAKVAVAASGNSSITHAARGYPTTVLALAHIRRGEMAAAKEALGRAIALDPQYAQARAWQSFLLRAEGRLSEAEEAARRAVALAPSSSLARQSLSDVQFALGNTGEAKSEAVRAVALNPLSPGARVSLGRALLQEGNVARAAEEANRAVALDPDLDRAQFFLGVVLAEQRRLGRAATALQQALAKDPAYLEARAFLARVYLAQGRRSDAVRVVQEAVERDPNFAPARAALGRVYWRAGRLRESVEEYRAALRQSPGSALYLLELARVYLSQNNLPDALAAGLAASSAAPTSSEARAVLGLIYDRMDNREQALQRYREAISLSPENALARVGFGLRNPSSSDGLRELAQSMLRDPSVIAELFKPGVTTEIAPGLGSNDRKTLDLVHRDQYARGTIHDFSFGAFEWLENYRDGRGERNGLAQTNVAAAPGYRTHVLGQYSYFFDESALPGPTFDPDRNDERAFWTNDWGLGLRQQLAPETAAWLHLKRTLLNSSVQNPDAPMDGDTTMFSRTRFSELNVEGRLDHRWGRRLTLTYVLFGGRNYTSNESREYEPIAAAFEESRIDSRSQLVTHTIQADYRPGSRFGLIVGATAERLTDRTQVELQDGTVVPLPEFDRTRWLPFAQATYLGTPRDLFRVILHDRRNRLLQSTLQPTEAFLVGEAPSVGAGGRARNLELDWEHRFSPRSFAKLFAFRSDVERFRVEPGLLQTLSSNGFNVADARVEGLGARYERQIGTFLSGYLHYTYSDTTDRTPRSTGGRQLPLNPRSRALLGFNYIDRAGTKLFLEANWRGPQYLDPIWSDDDAFDPLAPRPRENSKLRVNLRVAKERTVRGEWVVRINNLFNTSVLFAPGFPAVGRTYQVTYRYRF
jgi:tetratricopeptide (TPR) repeat protein